jgi:pilus assembly protein Flp/PilA
MKNLVKRFAQDESGATAIEYSLIAALIGVVLITGATYLGTTINAKFNTIGDKISAAGGQ